MLQMFRCPSCEKLFQINYSETITTHNKRGEQCQIIFCPYCGKKFYVIGGEKKVKTMTLYIAYDDTEFTDESECRAYEEEAENFLEELDYAYNFYDKDGKIILPICDDTIEDYLEWFDATTDKCEYIHVYKNISHELHNFLWRTIGVCIPEEKGFYKYDWNKNEWVSAS